MDTYAAASLDFDICGAHIFVPSYVLIDLQAAAKLLNYSPSGLRKLVARKAIKYFQARPHAPIKFKAEWLDEFVADGTTGPDDLSPVKRRAKAKPVAGSDFVDLSLFKI